MLLEDEQIELLGKFVEAHRSTPPDARAPFLAVRTQGATLFLHLGGSSVKFQGSVADAEVLARCGLLDRSCNSQGHPTFYVLPGGIAFYESSKRASPAVETVEDEIRRFLARPEISKAHSSALAKWEQAASLLWGADSAQQLTTIGHLCREVLQEFAASLAKQQNVAVSAIEPAKTIARLKAVLGARCEGLGKTEAAFLDVLVSYWDAVSGLVQRQEHGAQREGVILVWEDARRVVFQTLIVMYEVARAVR